MFLSSSISDVTVSSVAFPIQISVTFYNLIYQIYINYIQTTRKLRILPFLKH
jgi:hypothetical protein